MEIYVNAFQTLTKRVWLATPKPMRLIILTLHVLWVLWMVIGTAIAVLGYRFHRLWRMPVLRTTHLVAVIATATVPLWNRGICPLTAWEADVSGRPAVSLLARIFESILYWDVPTAVLSVISAAAAILTLAVYVLHPPWRRCELQSSRNKVGRTPGSRP